MSPLPAEIIEFIIDFIDDDRASLLSSSMIGRFWRTRSLAHLFRILQVTQEPYSSDRWWSATPVAFIRVTVDEFARLLGEFVHLVRFVVHLQIGDWMEDRRHDVAYARFLALLHLPEGHTVERLSLSGHFQLRPESLSCNFASLTMLRTNCSQYSDLGCFSACLAGLPALTHLEISGTDFSAARASDGAPPPSQIGLSPPARVLPCVFKLSMDTDAPALPEILQWIELARPHVGNVVIAGSIPGYLDRWRNILHAEPLGLLLRDPRNPRLRTICELDLSFEEVMLPAFVQLLNHLPEVHTARCRITFADIWPHTLSRLLTHDLDAPALRTLEIVSECNFAHTAFLEKPWELLGIAVNTSKWSELRSLVLRLRRPCPVARGLKDQLQRHLDTVFAGTKASVLLEDKTSLSQ